jgi:hypothetical protein
LNNTLKGGWTQMPRKGKRLLLQLWNLLNDTNTI